MAVNGWRRQSRRSDITATKPSLQPGVPPPLDGLHDAAAEALGMFSRVSAARSGWVNDQGADVGCNGSARSLLRHTANYLAAERLAGAPPPGAGLVDVGGGVGAFAAWLAGRLSVPATLVDADPEVLAVAGAAFPELDCRPSLEHLPDGSVWLLTAMEVVEHVPPGAQEDFVRELFRVLAPGGLLVLSTPDESRYLGGWSGYAPHIGVLDADGLSALLGRAAPGPVEVWRFSGGPFELGRAERVVLPVLNRAHGLTRRLAPGLVDQASHLFARVSDRRPERAAPLPPLAPGTVTLAPPERERGTGLLGVVRSGVDRGGAGPAG